MSRSKNSTMTSDIQLLTLNDAAKKIGCSKSVLQRMIRRGVAPAYVTIGRTVKFREAALQVWLDDQERASREVLQRNRAARACEAAA